MSSNDSFPTCAIRRTVEWRLFLSDRWCAGLTAIAATVSLWLEHRRGRRALAAFDDHQLRDIGLSRRCVARKLEMLLAALTLGGRFDGFFTLIRDRIHGS